MATETVTVARVYLREGEHLLDKLIEHLHDQEKVAGVTVLRGIAGFAADGKMRLASLVDLSLDLPLVVEFYDRPEKVQAIIDHLQNQLGLTHVISWTADQHLKT